MLDELQRRNYAQNTVRSYIHAVEDFAKYFRRSPDRLGPNHIREYQVHLFRDCKLSLSSRRVSRYRYRSSHSSPEISLFAMMITLYRCFERIVHCLKEWDFMCSRTLS